jgi:hypothetical protein
VKVGKDKNENMECESDFEREADKGGLATSLPPGFLGYFVLRQRVPF